jgi:hypothetical protein
MRFFIYVGLIFSITWFAVADSLVNKFLEGVHYTRVHHIRPQSLVELHYFFSFNCPACAKTAKVLYPFFAQQEKLSIHHHPLVMNQSTFQLARAYYLINDNDRKDDVVQSLFSFARYNQLSDERIINFFEKKGDRTFRQRWNSLSAEQVNQLSKANAERAQQYQLNAIPVCYVLGPKGAFMVHPSKQLPIESLPGCLNYLLAKQAV